MAINVISKIIKCFKNRGFVSDIKLLESVLLEDELAEADRLATQLEHEYGDDLPDITQGYLLPYMHGQAIWRSENRKAAPDMAGLEKAAELCQKSIDLKDDFADSQFILGLTLLTTASVQKIDDDTPDEWAVATYEESRYHLSEAVRLNPELRSSAESLI